jgi:hypothetical protein
MTNQSKPFIHVGGTSHFDFVMSCCGFFFSAGGDVPRVASTAEAVKEVWWLDSSGVAAHLDSNMSLWTSFFLGGVFFFGGVVVLVGRNFMKMPWVMLGSEKASANMDFTISLRVAFLGLAGVSATLELSFATFWSEDGLDMLIIWCRF